MNKYLQGKFSLEMLSKRVIGDCDRVRATSSKDGRVWFLLPEQVKILSDMKRAGWRGIRVDEREEAILNETIGVFCSIPYFSGRTRMTDYGRSMRFKLLKLD